MDQSQNKMDQEAANQSLLQSLKDTIAAQVGSDYTVDTILALTPVATEVCLSDKEGGRVFARVYRAPATFKNKIQEVWREHGTTLHTAFKALPQKAQGLKQMGNATAYVAAEAPGIDLETYLGLAGPVRPEFAVRTVVRLIRSLEKLAEMDCYHYQIHPANVVITAEGNPVLKNMGLHTFEHELARSMGVDELVDPTYSAPEQCEGQAPTPATDIYQLGLLMFRMVAGRPPYQGNYKTIVEGHKSKPLPNPQAVNKAVNVGFNRVLMKALAKNPAERFKDLKEFRTALGFLQPALERAEITGATDAGAMKLKEKDKAKVNSLLHEARQQANGKDLKGALRTLDSVFVLVGYHGEAARMHQKVWEALYGNAVARYTKDATVKWQEGKVAEALTSLNVAISVMPRYKEALALQTEIFGQLGDPHLRMDLPVDVQAWLGKAVEVKAENPLLAQGLWLQVLLMPMVGDEEARKQLSFQRQLAERGLNALKEELATLGQRAATPIALPEAEPEMAIDDFDDIFEADDVDEAPPPPKAAVPPIPAEPHETVDLHEHERDLLQDSEDIVDVGATARPAPPAKKKLSLPIILAAIALVVVLAAAGLVLKMRGDAQKREQIAAAAYKEADDTEMAGNLEKALEQWRELAANHPKFRDATSRQENLEYRIRERDHQVNNMLERVETQLAAGYLYEPDAEGKNVMELLASVNRLKPDEPRARKYMDEIRESEVARARALYEEKKVAEAREIYQRMVAADPSFRDDDLESKLNEWTLANVIQPGLARLDRAFKKQDWDEAREISEELRAVMFDAAPVDARWQELYSKEETRYQEAKIAGKRAEELEALSVMVEIRPDDTNLLEQRDRLNRDLNLEKITALEEQVKKARASNNDAKVAQYARQLLRMESNNQVGKNALAEIRLKLSEEIEKLKHGNPRKALARFADLLKVADWKSFRQARDALKERVALFDSGAARLKSDVKRAYSQRKTAVDEFLGKYSDFTEDSGYKYLTTLSKELGDEDQRLTNLIKWENSAANNVGMGYSEMLAYLEKNKGFKHPYGKERVAELITRYKDKIEYYDGMVTIVIRGASNLPKKGGGFLRGSGYLCELKSGGESFRTDDTKGTSPVWNHNCTFKAKPGAPLVFTVFEQSRKQMNPLGTITLPKVPESSKGVQIKPDGESWHLLIDVRRER